jgi:hypothetical protein
MELQNSVVIHKIFGKGIVVENDLNYITICFTSGTKEFSFPDICKEHLKFERADFNEQAQGLLKEKEEIARIKAKEQLKKKKDKEKELANVEAKRAEIFAYKKGVKKKDKKSNLAFKCTFCDGGQTQTNLGFRKVCSNDILKYNVLTKKQVWCSTVDCPCYQYYNKEISRERLDELSSTVGVCTESNLLVKWEADAGVYQNGKKAGTSKKMLDAQINSLAILTTRNPHAKDDTRYIFGVFLVNKYYEGDDTTSGCVTANQNYKIEMTPQEAEKLKFWNYYFNPNKPSKMVFGSGLFRYISDIQSAQILKDICKIKAGTKDAENALNLFEYFCKINGLEKNKLPTPSGAFVK